MTIKEFATLCNCNPQTLRYYDKEQALDLVKIKNLQNAYLSIDEIKILF